MGNNVSSSNFDHSDSVPEWNQWGTSSSNHNFVASDSGYSDSVEPWNQWGAGTSNHNFVSSAIGSSDSVEPWNPWGASTSYQHVVSSSDIEWVRLPEELVMLILDKLLESIDYVCFAVVCKEWYRLAKEKYTRGTERWYHRVRPPMLLLPPPGTKTPIFAPQTPDRRTLCSVSQGKVYKNIQLRVPFPKVRGAITDEYCCGCGHGWLAKVDVYHDLYEMPHPEWHIKLFNPFRETTTSTVSDPPIPPLEFPSNEVLRAPKVILSADPALNPNNFWVMAFRIGCRPLAFHKRGQNGWTLIDRLASYTDAIFYKEQFYAIDNRRGYIVRFSVEQAKIYRRKIEGYNDKAECAYLVESTKGDLLCVQRFAKSKRISDGLEMMVTERFKLYKLEFNCRPSSTVTQVEVTDIGDETLFVGDTPSVSFLSSNFPICKSNAIYYTDDSMNIDIIDPDLFSRNGGIPYDMGIFNLADETITPFDGIRRSFSPALWIMPTPPFDPLPRSNSIELTRHIYRKEEDKKAGRPRRWLCCFRAKE